MRTTQAQALAPCNITLINYGAVEENSAVVPSTEYSGSPILDGSCNQGVTDTLSHLDDGVTSNEEIISPILSGA